MKMIHYLLPILLCVSCSKQLSFVNHSGQEIQTMVFLTEDDVTNYSLQYDDMQHMNILKKNMLPKDRLDFDAKKVEVPYCIYYEDTEYQSYFAYQPYGEVINLSADDKLIYPNMSSLADTVSTIKINVDNQSNYYIRYVIVEADGYPQTYYALNQWNIVKEKHKETILFNGFEKGDPIISITLIGYRNGRKREIKYTKDLDDYLVFKF